MDSVEGRTLEQILHSQFDGVKDCGREIISFFYIRWSEGALRLRFT